MNIKTEKLPKSTIKLNITVDKEKVKEAYEVVLEEKVKTTTVEGFREGKAPKKMVEEKIGVSNLYGDVINYLLQVNYIQAMKEQAIAPISNPRIEIKEFDLEKDFEFTAEVATRPEVTINKDFRKKLKEAFEEKIKRVAKDHKENLEKLQKENEEKLKKGEELAEIPTQEPHAHLGANDVVEVLLEESKVDVADLIIEEEAQRMLEKISQQIQAIGLSVDQYLKAQGKTEEDLKKDYEKVAEKNIKAEFVLAQLVMDEKVEVTEEEITEIMSAAGVEGVQKMIEDPNERFYVKTILQKNKVLAKLIEEAEGEHHHEHK